MFQVTVDIFKPLPDLHRCNFSK